MSLLRTKARLETKSYVTKKKLIVISEWRWGRDKLWSRIFIECLSEYFSCRDEKMKVVEYR